MTQTPKLSNILNDLKSLTGIELSEDAFGTSDLEHSASELHKLCQAYREKYDKDHFFRRILKEALSTHEITEQAGKLHIDPSKECRLFLLETDTDMDDAVLSVLRHLFPVQNENHIFKVSEHLLVLLHALSNKEPAANQALQIAYSIRDTLNMELFLSVRISCGPQFSHLSELSKAYRKAQLALCVGKLFYSEQNVFLHDELRTGRLIYHLPKEVCLDFLAEIFHDNVPDTIDAEMLATINRFLQNNMNIAETARQLHMHRNTLIYRIEQVEKQTGLDIRNFEDAMTYKTALMVMNYINTK